MPLTLLPPRPPRLAASTPMYDMLKLFRTGRSHMALLVQPEPDSSEGSVHSKASVHSALGGGGGPGRSLATVLEHAAEGGDKLVAGTLGSPIDIVVGFQARAPGERDGSVVNSDLGSTRGLLVGEGETSSVQHGQWPVQQMHVAPSFDRISASSLPVSQLDVPGYSYTHHAREHAANLNVVSSSPFSLANGISGSGGHLANGLSISGSHIVDVCDDSVPPALPPLATTSANPDLLRKTSTPVEKTRKSRRSKARAKGSDVGSRSKARDKGSDVGGGGGGSKSRDKGSDPGNGSERGSNRITQSITRLFSGRGSSVGSGSGGESSSDSTDSRSDEEFEPFQMPLIARPGEPVGIITIEDVIEELMQVGGPGGRGGWGASSRLRR